MRKVLISILSTILVVNTLCVRAENIGVPSEYEGVMLQAFYWDSYDANKTTTKYGRTKWIDVLKDTAAINANFDLVWFPPSAQSSGGVGYYHTCLSDQGSTTSTAWGSKGKLDELIAAFHKGNTKAIADIVINHRGNSNSWTSFYPDNFGGSYGTWQLKQEHICAGDEAFTDSGSPAYRSTNHGASDTGTNDGGARDLDHTNEYVQNWAKAYVRWMINEMKYDGFRYDMTLGYHGRYLSMYNEEAKPFFSVSELWDGLDRQVTHLQQTNYNTMIFDFPLKYSLAGIPGESYGKLNKNKSLNSLRSRGLEKYSVTFIDNHDTFERPDNQGGEYYKYQADLDNATTKNYILQANAYILMMPGVPCVFWPHWNKYKDEISALIAVRKLAGIHSESAVSDEESGLRKYTATIQGHKGKVIVRLGKSRDMEVPEGYRVALEGGNAGDYTILIEKTQGIEDVQGQGTKGEKFVKDGQLLIRRGDKVYTLQGQEVK